MPTSTPRSAPQRPATELRAQEELPLRHRDAVDVPLDVQYARARECLSFGDSMQACATVAHLDFDKQVSSALGFDKAQLSRWHNNSEGIRENRFFQLQHLCGNYVPLFYLVDRAGFDLTAMRIKEDRLERENRELREQLAAARKLLIGAL